MNVRGAGMTALQKPVKAEAALRSHPAICLGRGRMVGFSQGTEGGLSWQAVDEAPPSRWARLRSHAGRPSARRETCQRVASPRSSRREIIPRLMLAHSMPCASRSRSRPDEGDQVEAFTALVRADDMKAISAAYRPCAPAGCPSSASSWTCSRPLRAISASCGPPISWTSSTSPSACRAFSTS